MPSFQYQSLTTNGSVRTGVVTANDRSEAVRLLLSRGETATRVDPIETETGSAAKKQTGGLLAGWGSRQPTLGSGETANLIRELATALEAGLPLMAALKTVRRQARGKALPGILDHLIERVEAGDPLYAAAQDYGPPFNDMIVGMLRAADASGEMSTVMHQLSDLLERNVELRRELVGATFYPMIVASLVVVSTIVLVTVLVPRLIEPLAGEGGFTMPLPTRIVLGFATFFQQFWFLALAIIGGVWIVWHLWSAIPANRLTIDRLLLKTPLLGRLLRDVAVARFTRTLGTLTAAGLPILEALKITRKTLGNLALIDAVEQVQDQVTSGKSLAEPLERSGLFPPLLIQVVSLGERAGRLDSMLIHAASAFDRQVNTSINLFTKALPPLLLIIMASVGGFVLAAILLPLLELQSIIG